MKGKINLLTSIFFLVLMIVPYTLAADSILPVGIPLTLDFTGERDFKLSLPDGFERTFSWTNGTQEPDSTFTYTYYYHYNLTTLCNQAGFGVLTDSFSQLTGSCGQFASDALTARNKSEEYLRQMSDLRYNKTVIESALGLCTDKRDWYKNLSDTCTGALQESQKKNIDDLVTITGLERSVDQKAVCEQDLTEALKAKSSYGFFGLMFGLGIGYMLWGRKKKNAPSEMQENRSGGAPPPDYAYQPEGAVGGYYDEPRQ